MAKRHKIDGLEPEVRELIARLLKRPRGVDEFTALANRILEESGCDERLSRSSAHRWMQDFEAERKAMRETREIAKAFKAELGEIPDNDGGRLLQEMLHTVIFKVLRPEMTGENPSVDSRDLMMLARALKDTMTALKGSVDLELRIRQETAKQAAGEVERVAGEKGLTADTVAAIKAAVLGVTRP